jgi:3-hydroxyisobutyrate dehydrogenase-like beta-hydroxyacid dehydrogenase
MNNLEKRRVAVLGLGIIGSRACQRLVEAGWNVAAWNRTPKGLACEVATPQEAVGGAEIIPVYLRDSPAVRAVFESLTSYLKPGQIVLNHATLDLETTHWLADLCGKCGCRFLDAPFTGSKVASGNGQLVYYIGGDEALAADMDDFLSVTSKARLFCGAVGSATIIKLATNLISACTVQAMAEALAITTHHGVSGECLALAVSQNASGSVLSGMKFSQMLGGDYEAHFSLANMHKDSRYMLALAESAKLETPAIGAVSNRMADLCEQGMGDDDFSVLAKPYLQS